MFFVIGNVFEKVLKAMNILNCEAKNEKNCFRVLQAQKLLLGIALSSFSNNLPTKLDEIGCCLAHYTDFRAE